MTEQQIKRAKRLAEMLFSKESYNTQVRNGAVWICHNSSMEWHIFNPEQDKALLWDLQIKFGVTVDRYLSECYAITFGDSPDGMDNGELLCEIEFKDESEIPAALIDCVIEINGGYDD